MSPVQPLMIKSPATLLQFVVLLGSPLLPPQGQGQGQRQLPPSGQSPAFLSGAYLEAATM